ncbi:SEC-C metal-binding domain-containing protein [Photobacterium damselae]|uniref:SEC-C metal-binding domain-containing protein n=1 Tax=Photobacterium damselae TaxID=38293 RepID=UPI0018A40D8B|nr:SEC-C metal-binding domain-containing protein [Photobacterium damselae]QOQ69351.1 SEC-C domain-containing protein [Photobacterium damselae subsp. damselae]
MTDLIKLPDHWQGMSATFIEGALFAANSNSKPMEPEVWLPELLGSDVALSDDDKTLILNHFELQYRTVKAGEYQLDPTLVWAEENRANLAQFAQGFLSVWQHIEPNWAEQPINDGTMRMLSALLTTLMLLVDEEETRAQMQEAGIDAMPELETLCQQLSLMLTEVMMAGDELQIGAGAQAVNPFKDVGRNDACPCGSGKKFKQCCGK